MPQLQLGFHTSFALKKDDIIRILEAATEDQGLNDSLENLIDRTKLGNKKVGPMRSWAIRSGLVSGDRLSPEGAIAWKYDFGVKPENRSRDYNDRIIPVTDWLMHFYLSLGVQGAKDDRKSKYTGVGETLQPPPTDPAEWGGWTYFVYAFLPDHKTFTLDELQTYCASIFAPGTGKHPEKDLRDNLRIVLRAYCEPEAIAGCKFLAQTDKEAYTAEDSDLPNLDLMAYFLAKLWQRDFSDATSVLTDDILQQPMGLASVLGVNTSTLQTVLNQLETAALIEQRRTVSPAQIIRRWHDPLTLLEKSYTHSLS
ncbi:MAG: hypothetical protein KME42_21955 [Tildeniella nuda ZEHNDER 1965/U140]|jgi:hypothetical protein|nr:hypothetical protein [Tildeniella nuda ZEHNDER 1965/U140]